MGAKDTAHSLQNGQYQHTSHSFTEKSQRPLLTIRICGFHWRMYAYQYIKYLQLEKIVDDEFLSKLVLNEHQEWRLTYFIWAMHGVKVDIDVSHLASNQYCINA
jgi:hypothetical protein